MINQSLLEDNKKIIYKFCHKHPLKNMPLEDWINHCYMKILSVIDRYNYKNKFSTFVYSVLNNERKNLMKNDNIEIYSINDAIVNDECVDNLFKQIEDKIYLKQILNKLKDKDKEFMLEVLDYIKINGDIKGYAKYLARKYNVSTQCINNKFNRIKKKLQIINQGGMD